MPYQKRQWKERFSATTSLIVINLVVSVVLWIMFAFSSENASTVVNYLAVNPQRVTDGYFWTLLTSAFVHLNPTHLFVNMLSLFFIGNLVEQIIGRKRFVWFYLLAGVVASIVFVALAYAAPYVLYGPQIFGSVTESAVGASGAIFGLAALLTVLLPKLRVLVFFVIPMYLWIAMIVLLFGLWILSAVGGLPIGNTAHFGGLLLGLAYGFYLRSKYPSRVHMLNRMFRS